MLDNKKIMNVKGCNTELMFQQLNFTFSTEQHILYKQETNIAQIERLLINTMIVIISAALEHIFSFDILQMNATFLIDYTSYNAQI